MISNVFSPGRTLYSPLCLVSVCCLSSSNRYNISKFWKYTDSTKNTLLAANVFLETSVCSHFYICICWGCNFTWRSRMHITTFQYKATNLQKCNERLFIFVKVNPCFPKYNLLIHFGMERYFF